MPATTDLSGYKGNDKIDGGAGRDWCSAHEGRNQTVKNLRAGPQSHAGVASQHLALEPLRRVRPA